MADLLNDREAALLGHVTLLREESDNYRARIADLESRVRFLEERLSAITRPRTLLTVAEAATAIGVSQRTLKRWRDERNPRIAFILLEGGDVRYRAEAIESYLQGRERGAKSALRAA